MGNALYFNSGVFKLRRVMNKNLSHAKKNVFNCEYGYSVCLKLWCRGIRLQDVITQSVILCILEIPVLSLSQETGFFSGVFLYFTLELSKEYRNKA